MRFGEWSVPLTKECPTTDKACRVPTRNTWMGCAMELWNVRGGILLPRGRRFPSASRKSVSPMGAGSYGRVISRPSVCTTFSLDFHFEFPGGHYYTPDPLGRAQRFRGRTGTVGCGSTVAAI